MVLAAAAAASASASTNKPVSVSFSGIGNDAFTVKIRGTGVCAPGWARGGGWVLVAMQCTHPDRNHNRLEPASLAAL